MFKWVHEVVDVCSSIVRSRNIKRRDAELGISRVGPGGSDDILARMRGLGVAGGFYDGPSDAERAFFEDWMNGACI